MLNDTQNNLSDVNTNIKNKLNEFGQKVSQTKDDLLQQGEDLACKLKKEASEYTDTVAKYIKENPAKAALIAGGVGLLLGKLLKR